MPQTSKTDELVLGKELNQSQKRARTSCNSEGERQSISKVMIQTTTQEKKEAPEIESNDKIIEKRSKAKRLVMFAAKESDTDDL